ncbi:MAG: hypothetical protein ACK4V6_01520, partial [Microthrixaceae bacterium]
GILAVVVIAGLMFVVGLVLLIVGLVQRSRARKTPPAGPYLPGGYPAGPYPPGQYPGGQYPAPPAAPSPEQGPSDGPAPWTGAPPEAPPSAPDPATDPDRTPDPGASGWTIPPSKQQ